MPAANRKESFRCVFRALELTPQKDAINRSVSEALDKAGIPVVLLDRDLVPPERSQYDLVGIDNHGPDMVTRHLIRCGCRRLVFLGRPGWPPPWTRASWDTGSAHTETGHSQQVCRIDPDDRVEVKRSLTLLGPMDLSAPMTSPPPMC